MTHDVIDRDINRDILIDGFAEALDSVSDEELRECVNVVQRWLSGLKVNDRLITAAPALLAACKQAFVALPDAKHNDAINAALKAAIALADEDAR